MIIKWDREEGIKGKKMWYDIWTLRKFPGIFTTQMSISSIIPKQNAKKVSQNDIPSEPSVVVNNSNLINELWLQYFCWFDFSCFFLHLVKLVCRLNFVSYFLWMLVLNDITRPQASWPDIFCCSLGLQLIYGMNSL